MSNDPTPEATSPDDRALEAALDGIIDNCMPLVNAETVRSIVRALREEREINEAAIKQDAVTITTLRAKLAEVEGKLALVEAENERLKGDVQLWEARSNSFEADAELAESQLTQLRAENERLNAERAEYRKKWHATVDEGLATIAELRAALTTQQEAMDTAVRALEYYAGAPWVGHSGSWSNSHYADTADAALAQLRASRAADRASQFPENGNGDAKMTRERNLAFAYIKAIWANNKLPSPLGNELFDALVAEPRSPGLLIMAVEPTAKTDGEAMK